MPLSLEDANKAGGQSASCFEYAAARTAPSQYNVSSMDAKPVELFYSYSHKDEGMRQRLETHLSVLKRAGAIAGWHDRRIGAGAEWKQQISDHLESADVILLLISSDFLASDYCWDIEMKRALERHDRGDALVIPIMLHPVDWEGAPFAKLEVLPRDGRPVSKWSKQDEAFTDVAKGIRAAVRRRLEANASTSPFGSPFSVELWTAGQRTAANKNQESASQTEYSIGTRIVVRFRANRDCYLTLLNIGTSGKLTVLFPNALHSDDRIQKDRLYEIPGPDDEFEYEITGPPGVETLKAIATLEKTPLLETQFAPDGSLFRTVSGTAAARDIAVVSKRAATVQPDKLSERECRFRVV